MESIKALFHNAIDRVIDNKEKLVVVVLLALGITGGVMGYQAYRQRVEARAHRSFVEAMKYFTGDVKGEQASTGQELDAKFFTSAIEKWEQTAQAFHQAYENNRSSALAGIFLAYESESYSHLGDYQRSLELLRSALPLIKNNNIAQLYQLKLGLLLLDGPTEALQVEGMNTLKTMAAENSLLAQEGALYRLGEYYWHKRQFDDVKNYWGQLVQKFGEKDEADRYTSNWAELAASKLKLIESK